MKVLARIAAPALLVAGTLLASPQSASATDPFTMSAACTPGFPACNSMRFVVDANEDIGINSLALTFVSGWSFAGAPVSTYSGEDAFGPLGGAAYISNASKTATMTFFADLGFPFEVLGGTSGYLDLAVSGQGDIAFTCFAELADRRTVECAYPREPGPGVPEPLSLVLLGTGLAGVALVRRRRNERLVA